jgi:type I restriction enzyme M protein
VGGTLFEQLIRRFNEDIYQNPGEHFTPKDAIRLLVRLVLSLDSELDASPAINRTVADPACGTGGILTVARERIRKHAPQARVHISGQEINPRTCAVCKSGLLDTIKIEANKRDVPYQSLIKMTLAEQFQKYPAGP